MRICVLREGAEYQARHVQWLAKQILGLQCLSDVEVPGVPTIPLKYGWPGWWAKLELFRPDIKGDLFYFDLDTVVTGSLDHIAPDKSLMLEDFYRPERPGSGLMFIKHEDKQAVWDAWLQSQDTHYKPTHLHHGDQGFLWDHFPCGRWQDAYPGLVQSYKVHVRRKQSPDSRIICFHGNPKPWQVNAPWIPSL